jgi:predicted phosphate transport protein (TIGR00153 family)
MSFRLLPKDPKFFELFIADGDNLEAAASALNEMVEQYDRLDERIAGIQALEKAGDEIDRAVTRKLEDAFITPFDREDIHGLASALDDCMDLMDATVDLIVLYRIGDLPAGVSDQVEVLSRMSELTADAMPRLRSMKDLSEYWIEINRLENQADQIYRRLLAGLFNGDFGSDAITIMKLKEVIEELEAAADAFEKVAHKVESIAVKES